MPIGFAFMALRFILTPAPGSGRRWIALLGVPFGLVIGWTPLASSLQALLPGGSHVAAWLSTAGPAFAAAVAPVLSALHLPLVIVLVASVFLGGPIFVLVGGLALLFFLHSGGALETAANQAYTMLTGDVIPSIPLFTLAGYIISESKSGERLVRLFRTLFGWLPGRPGLHEHPHLRIPHDVHRRLGRHDHRRGDPAAVHPEGRRIRRTVRKGPAHRIREHRPALPAEPAR